MRRSAGFVFAGLSSLLLVASAQQTTARAHRVIEVEIANPLKGGAQASALEGPFTGRLIIQLAQNLRVPTPPRQSGPPLTSEQQSRMTDLTISSAFNNAARVPSPGFFAAAMDVSNVKPGDVIEVDVDKLATPAPFSSLPPGEYFARAILDSGSDFAIANMAGPMDLFSQIQRITLGGAPPRLTVVSQTFTRDWRTENDQMRGVSLATRDVDFTSPSLSAFYGKPTHIRGYVLLPRGYDAGGSDTYPVAYDFGLAAPFGQRFDMMPVFQVLQRHSAMYKGAAPPMIWVMLDQNAAEGPHGFMDSGANGPWASAFTDEFIPWIEAQYHTDAKPSGRILVGGGSGGRTALWLLAKRPKLFAGAWADSPDPVDFHSFYGTDIYASRANFFGASGDEKLIFRERSTQGGWIGYSAKALSSFETIYGPGGRLASTERMYAPLLTDGKPQPLFDRSTGAIDPVVAKYWGEHYDLANYLASRWPELKGDLDGKIHIVAGAFDKWRRNVGVENLKQRLDGLGAKTDIRILDGRTEDQVQTAPVYFGAEIYAVVRPGVAWARARN